MNINGNDISTGVNMPVDTSVEDLQVATEKNSYLQKLKSYIKHGWPKKR